MTKFLLIITLLAPLTCFSQISINGTVLDRSNNRPVEYANVFLNNSSIGTTTDENGRFTLQNVKPGNYDLIISFIGYQTYHQKVTINNTSIKLSNVFIDLKTTNLKEVTIKPKNEEDRYNYLAWFKEEFIGKSQFSLDCKILNPDVLDFDYDKTTHKLTASASGFLQIKNSTLGYNIKFLLNEFELSNKGEFVEKVHYDGWALFEKMKGSASEERRWQRMRQRDYEGSPKQFLSSLTVPQWTNEFSQSFQDGFWVMRLVTYPNPKCPSDSSIQAKINYFKKTEITGYKDSLSRWKKIDDLPKSLQRLYNDNLSTGEFVRKTNQKGIYALGLSRASYSLLINYQKDRLKKAKNGRITLALQPIDNLSSARNTENTLINFNNPFVFFDRNGEVLDVSSLAFQGYGPGDV